jgi:hypothetical protein
LWLSRRELLIGSSASALAVGLGARAGLGCGDDGEPPRQGPGIFFSTAELATLAAACDRILPGAAAAGATAFIEKLLTAFDFDPPPIFAGGPFSGRAPYPDPATGAPSTDYPANDFAGFLPLTAGQDLAWRIRLYGSAATAGGDFNDAVLGPVVGWRDHYREGVTALADRARADFDAGFATLSLAEQDRVIDAVTQTHSPFVDLLVDHTVESLAAAPEYGGNAAGAGWAMLHYDGDSQPLGYSLYDPRTDTYSDRTDLPNTGPNPGEDYAGFSAETVTFLAGIVGLAGGTRFF